MIIKTNLSLSDYNSYKINAVAEKVYFPDSVQDFVEIFQNDENKHIVGGGNNIILGKELYNEASFVIISENYSQKKLERNLIQCESGADLKVLSEFALENEMSGLEMFYDIPGTIGGAIIMNAGSKDISISDLISEVTFLDKRTLKIYTKKVNQLKWGYRYSEFQENDTIIISAGLKLIKGKYASIKEKMDENYRIRHEKQPRDFPNAGSVFKRPEGFFVGKIMEDLNLKGLKVGGAMISEKHGGFIINFNNAIGKDVIDIIEKVKEKVYKELKINLEIEQQIIL